MVTPVSYTKYMPSGPQTQMQTMIAYGVYKLCWSI